jgi:RimJ/RimL family protein N-acetyltransferase
MLRPVTLDDASGVTALQSLVYPEFVRTVAGVRHNLALVTPGAQTQRWCVEDGGRLVGMSYASLQVQTTELGVGHIDVSVHPDYRGRGFGGELYDIADSHLSGVGVRRLLAESRSDAASVAFARSRDYEQIGSNDILRVDPRRVEAFPEPRGVTVVPFAAFSADPAPLHRVDAAATLDEPGGVTWDAISYDIWFSSFWESPSVDHDASMATLVEDDVVSLTWLRADRAGGRATNAGTGTHPDHRGRGYATAAKRASLIRAGELGITAVYTGNDATNAAMQAVNRKLGYEPFSTEISWEKTLPATTNEPSA